MEKQSKGQLVKFWFSCKWDGIRAFFKLIPRLPGFYRLNRFWDQKPEFYGWVIQQYVAVMNELTGGKLRKPSHDAITVIEAVCKNMDVRYVGQRKEGNNGTNED